MLRLRTKALDAQTTILKQEAGRPVLLGKLLSLMAKNGTCNAVLGNPVHLCGADDDFERKQVRGSEGEDGGMQCLQVARQIFNTA